jgi:two-component system, NarL family, invasion response regulator UvrY
MQNVSVAIVDDHGVVRDGLRKLLTSHGYDVVAEAADANTAYARVLRTNPDLLLLDVGLAQRSGLDLLARLRQRSLRAQVVVLSMSSQAVHVANAWRLGVCAYVLKGSPSAVLMQGIRAALEGGRFLDPALAKLVVDIDAYVAADPLATLSLSEREVFLAMVQGRTSHEIAAQLHLSAKTIDSYRSRVMAKMGVQDLPALVRLSVRLGLLDVGV